MKEPSVKANLKLSIYGESLEMSVEVPTSTSTVRRMLPIFREVSHSIISTAVKHAEAAGRNVSCAAGCGACCRQMVPISPAEAIQIRELFDDLPAERKERVTNRFEEAIETLGRSGLLDRLRNDEKPLGAEYKELGLEYFHQGIPCPFLENESCSIHPDRPLVCREYLVVSAPENCSRQNGQPIEVIGIPHPVSKAVTGLNGPKDFTNWVPLTLALEWAEQHTNSDAERPGTEIAEAFFKRLLGN